MFRTRNKNRVQLKQIHEIHENRRKRGELTCEIRKKNRNEQLQKRRTNSQHGQFQDNFRGPTNAREISTFVEDCKSTDRDRQLNGTKGLRKLLSIQDSPPIQAIINTGVIPRLVTFLKSSNSALQFEAAWALTNIVSGTQEQTRSVITHGAVQHLTALLSLSQSREVREQAAWALSNIAGDSIALRDLVLQSGALRGLVLCCAPTKQGRAAPLSLVRTAVWAISNLCRGKPEPPFESLKNAIPCLTWLVANSHDEEVIKDGCWALSYLSDDNTQENIKIEAILNTGIACRLAKLLESKSRDVLRPVLRVIGNLISGSDQQAQRVIEQGVLTRLTPLLRHQLSDFRKEVCWIVSNITAGTDAQIEQVVLTNNHLIIKTLIQLLTNDVFSIQREAAWALCNIANSSQPAHVQLLVRLGALAPLSALLTTADMRLVLAVLEAVDCVLRLGHQLAAATHQGDNIYCIALEECGGLDKIEALQRHSNDAVYHKAVNIITKYFNEDDEMIATSTSNDCFFFGSNNSELARPVEQSFFFDVDFSLPDHE